MSAHSIMLHAESVEKNIIFVRNQKVILDTDLAKLFGVETKAFNRAVRRNMDRFPEDFMFRLTAKEHDILRCQIGTSRSGHGGRRYLPYAFSEHGVVMAANVLNSKQAIEASLWVVRAFIRLRQLLATHEDLRRKLDELEHRYDHQFVAVFEAIRELMEPPPERRKDRIGFKPTNDTNQNSVKTKFLKYSV